ncbi:MAG: hypothetical protein ABJF10_20955, partial [Chthoniobacter sp.]|uniref:hypothetical protein n=1 Tax=Chthoniobacter sp. TaxID=2510640 RepID=UPI0032AC0F3F
MQNSTARFVVDSLHPDKPNIGRYLTKAVSRRFPKRARNSQANAAFQDLSPDISSFLQKVSEVPAV